MSLRELITPQEIEMIDDRRYYALNNFDENRCSVFNLLSPWEWSKSHLAELFDGKLILKKENIDVKASIGALTAEMEDTFYFNRYINPSSSEDKYVQFLYNLAKKVKIGAENGQFSQEFVEVFIRSFSDSENLALNRFRDTFDLKNNQVFRCKDLTGREFELALGSKMMKVWKKVAAAVGGVDGLQDAINKHSEILNGTRMKGTLCLSIHPLDFLTMSDNNLDWHSCLSIEEEGEFRQGVMEMMNSPYVVIAYVESASSPMSIRGYNWNSKKFRSLYIVTEEIICNIKGYPFRNTDIDKIVVDWLRDLTAEHWNIEWTEQQDFCMPSNPYDLHFYTDIMYNDCYLLHKKCKENAGAHIGYINAALADTKYTYCLNYSGDNQCMICGCINSIDCNDESALACPKCLGAEFCERCGNYIFSDDTAAWIDDKLICEDCLNRECEWSASDQEIHLKEDMTPFILSIDGAYKKGRNDYPVLCTKYCYNDDLRDFIKDQFADYVQPSELTRIINYIYENPFFANKIYVNPSALTPAGWEFFGYETEADINWAKNLLQTWEQAVA